MLVLAPAVASTASGGTAAESITVWLQVDAQAESWQPIVNAANAQFEKDHPGVTVDVQYQTWGDHLKKFDATLAGGDAPDVIEMGNTEMTKYVTSWKAPAAMYFVISVLPISMTSGAFPPASVASNFFRWSVHV